MVIAPYFKKSAKQIRVSLFHMKLVINHIFRSGFGVKRAIAMMIGGYVCPELEIHHHFIPREIHPGDRKPASIYGNFIMEVRIYVWR